MMVRHIRLDRRQFYLFEGLGINSQYGILKRSGSEKNGEEPHNPVFKAHT